ncbi:LOW QUALITY PROTEIN: filamin-A [Procambarus clarkii]|uniref:LOW QUALITY PROTEIN: filamin-A n=1 Tax=Procambarus clarkii TaxID=6728 RepID=UPI003744925D
MYGPGAAEYCQAGHEEDEMAATERELAEDAQWKRIQQNTFTRWANEHLKSVNKHIGNLETDLSDGLRLIALIEVLSGKQLPKHNKRPNFKSQKLENVSVALQFLERDENIRIINIDSSDIVDCKLKLILGLIWTLILNYSISMPMWDGEVQVAPGEKGPSPKQRLLHWIQSKLPDLPITNFTNDWNDGRAVGALVDAVAAGLCPDWPDWVPADALSNATEAMNIADNWLGVPQLITPEEMLSPSIDEQSMMTYLSQYPNCKLKSGAPLRPRTNPGKVRCYGPGIESSGPVVGAPTNFTIETFSAGKGKVEAFLQTPDGRVENLECKFNNDRNLTYTCKYTPQCEGDFVVIVKFSGREIPKSPFRVNVSGFAGDPTKVTASGPGLEPEGVTINKPTYFDIFTKDPQTSLYGNFPFSHTNTGRRRSSTILTSPRSRFSQSSPTTLDAGRGTPEVIILDPAGHKNTVPVKTRSISEDVYRCEYVASGIGLHSINIFFAGQSIPGSPYGVKVSPVCDARKVRASGRGLQPNGVRVKDSADFKVHTEGAGEGNVEVKVIGPGGTHEVVKTKQIDAFTFEYIYHPKKEGRYIVMVTYGGQEIPKSPFEVNIGPYKETRIRAYGPGLKGGVVGYPALFTVETNGEAGGLGFSIEGPSQAKIDCNDNGDGSADVRYYPTAPGEYALHILCNNEDIPGSPYIAQILPQTDYYPELVKCKGPGLEKNGLVSGRPADFQVDTRKAGDAPLDVTVMDANYQPIKLEAKDNKNGTYDFSYRPTRGNKHTVQVNYGGVATDDSPYRVFISEPSDPGAVKVFGPGVERGVKSNTPTHFNIDCREAGPGEVQIALTNAHGQDIPIEIQDNSDGTFTVEYLTPSPGDHRVTVLYAGSEIPQSPIVVPVQSHVDVTKVKVDGLEPTAPINSLQQFRVITQDAGRADFAVSITSPSGMRVRAHVVPTHEGYLVNFTPTELGEYLLSIQFGGQPISSTPYRFTCTPGGDASAVRAWGPGLEGGIVCRPAEFVIDTREAGQGGLGVTVEGPCEAAINCRDNGDGTCAVAYLPTEAGPYTINITFNERHIHGSPFHALIGHDKDLKQIRVTGNGIQPHGVFVDSPTDFVVDTRALANLRKDTKGSDKGDGKVMCVITNPSGTRTDSFLRPLTDGTYKISYTPFEEGRHTIDLLYDGVPVPGSPFTVNVRRGCDPNKCQAFGPGLDHGFVNEVNTFTVETKGAGTGGLGLAVEGPSEAKMTCKDNRDGSCTVEYVPLESGDYDVSIKFADQHIPGSPFKVSVDQSVDASQVVVWGSGLEPGKVRAGVPLTFHVDGSKSGKAPLGVDITTDKGSLPKSPDIRDNGDGTYDVTYVPHAEGTMQTANITWGGKPVPGSPFRLRVRPASASIVSPLRSPYRTRVRPAVEPSRVKVSGSGVSSKGIPASLPTELVIDTNDAGIGDLQVSVTGPDGHPRKVKVVDNGDGTFSASYVPDDCGKYKVSVKYADQEVGHTPFPVQAYATGKADKCKITEGINHSLTIGEEYCITVNAKNAGSGAVTCRIRSTSGSDLDIDIEDNGDGTFSIYYTVKDAGEYTLSVKFGGQPVPDGFYSFTAQSEEEYQQTQTKVNGLQRTPSGGSYRPVELHNIPLPTTGGHVTAEVRMPSGDKDLPVIEDNRDGTVSVRYSPREEGLHELHVKYNAEHVQGSPFKFHVDSISSGYVTAYGSGLVHGITGEPCNFTISTKDAGAGGLSLAVEGSSKAEISCHDNKDGTVSVSYLPTAPGEYKVSVKFAEKHIKGSPYSVKITGEGRKRNQISVGSQSEVSLPGKVTDSDIKSLNASIQAPSGLEEPCFLKKLPNGHLGISFTPREVGEHLVSVKRMGTHIANSPFKITVGEKEVGDASKVKITGKALTEGVTHTENQFTIDTREAGYGGLSLSVEGPSKADIQCKDNEDGTLTIGYKPTEPGYYIINLKFADNHVHGSPFTAKVTGEGTNRQTERIKRQREAVPLTEVGSQCRLTFKLPGISPFDLGATVTSPGGVTEGAELGEVEDGLYGVNFVPKELGVHTVSVKYQEMHIPGSPFQFTVGPLKDGGAHRVHAGGPGLERGEQNMPSEFNVWTREAGAGSLAISVEGPSKAEIDFKDRKDGSCYVSYVVQEPGEYRVGIKFNDKHIPDSPYKVYITPSMGEARKVEVAQFPDQGSKPNKPQSLLVSKNGAQGHLDCKTVAPSGQEEDCFTDLLDNDTYSVRFVPKEIGIHFIHVKFNGIHIPGSPFRLRIGKDEADPAAVSASGKGLESAISAQKTDFIVDTCNAGAGTLAVTIDGPSKVSMDCTEVEEGYKVRYTPLVPGDYYIAVKYNGYHIAGSPWKVKCTGEPHAEKGTIQESSSVVVETVEKTKSGALTHQGPVIPRFQSDATKVTSKGLGLKKAHINRQNNFTVNASTAGTNILYVGVYGPKAPCEEVYIKHIGHNNYQIGYVVRDKGDYLLIVKWGDDHIPGSPFHVTV